MDISKRLIALREQCGYTQNGLAERAGVSQTHLRRVERGEADITVGHLQLLCDAMNVSLKEFFSAQEADDELAVDSSLPKHQCLYKLLRLLNGEQNRKAEYRCAVTLMDSNGKYKQIVESSKGFIDTKINEPIKKPYFYSLFVDAETKKPFNTLTSEELGNTYRYKALTKAFLSTVNTQSRNK